MEIPLMNNPDLATVLSDFTATLDSLDILYFVGGSVASSLFGTVRFTQDADICVEPFNEKVDDFIAQLGDKYYISSDALRHALHNRTSFNVIHIQTVFKIDVFVQANNLFEKQMMSRKIKRKLSVSGSKYFSFATPEDVILLKLRWYKQGGCTSERQQTDISGIIKTQAENLDYEYITSWADKLGLSPELKTIMKLTETDK